MTGCLNGGSCVNDEKKQKYLCLSKKAWTGKKCETKLGKKRYYSLVSVSFLHISKFNDVLSLRLELQINISFCFH